MTEHASEARQHRARHRGLREGKAIVVVDVEAERTRATSSSRRARRCPRSWPASCALPAGWCVRHYPAISSTSCIPLMMPHTAKKKCERPTPSRSSPRRYHDGHLRCRSRAHVPRAGRLGDGAVQLEPARPHHPAGPKPGGILERAGRTEASIDFNPPGLCHPRGSSVRC